MAELLHRELTDQIFGVLIEVHRELGPGLLESAYEESLCFELSQRQLEFRRQIQLPLRYKAIRLDCGYVIDLIVAECVLLELKAVEKLLSIHESQLMTYLKLTGLRVGLLVNFNVPVMKDGIVRRVL